MAELGQLYDRLVLAESAIHRCNEDKPERCVRNAKNGLRAPRSATWSDDFSTAIGISLLTYRMCI